MSKSLADLMKEKLKEEKEAKEEKKESKPKKEPKKVQKSKKPKKKPAKKPKKKEKKEIEGIEIDIRQELDDLAKDTSFERVFYKLLYGTGWRGKKVDLESNLSKDLGIFRKIASGDYKLVKK
jgi:hypothetical protein